MSGSKPSVNIRIGTEGAEKARRDFEAVGQSGEAALKRVGTASAAATPELQKMAGAADVANRAFVGMGGSLGRVGEVAGRVSGVAGGVTVGFLALGAAAATSAVAIAKAGDTATATLAKLTSSTGGIGAAQAAYEGLFRLSQQTGVAVAESAGAFTRFGVAAKEIGGTNEQVLRLVSGIQKAGIVAGASMEETKAASQQLAQALASGVLQGDELRSLLENMPQLAQALARELGVGIGQLKQMGSEGKLTADVVFPALLAASGKLNDEFDKMPPTMERAKNVLLAATQDFGERLDRITGLSQTFAAAMMQGAGALRAMGTMIAPNEREQAATSVTQAQERLRRVQEQARADAAASAYGDSSPAMREAIGIAESDLREALARQQAILRDDRELRRAEEEDAARQRLVALRTDGDRRAQALEKDLKTESSIREKFRKQREEIDRIEASGARSPEQIAAMRAASIKEEADALDKLVEKHKEVAKEAKDANEHVEAWYKQQEKAAQETAKAQEKAAEAIRKYHESSFDAVANIGERAMDRVGDALVQAFVQGEGAAVNFGNIARAVLGSIVADLAKLAVVNPLLNSLFPRSSGPRDTLAGAFGGGGTTGGAGLFTSVAGLGDSALKLISPSSSISTGALGGYFSSVAGGFGVGSLIGGLVAKSQAQRSNSMIGAGLGALTGNPLLAVLGGVVGGMFGPKDSVKGYGYQLNAAPDGLLQMGPSFYNETGQAAFQEAAQGIAQINQYFGQRGIRVGGASIVGGNKNGADYSHATAGSFSEGLSQLFYSSTDTALDFAMADKKGRKFGSTDELQAFVEGFYAIQDVIKGLTAEPIPAFTQQLNAVNDNFAAAIAKAREYSLAEDALNTARDKAIAKLEQQRTEQLMQSDASLTVRMLNATGDTRGGALAQQAEAARQEVINFTAALETLGISAEDKAARLVRLEEVQAAERAAIITRFGEQASTALDSALSGTNLLRELTYGGSSALAPSQKYFAAISDLSAARQALDAGGSLSAYTAVAQAVLPVARDFLGTSTRYAGLAAEVGNVIASKGGDGNLAAILSAQVDATGGLGSIFAAYGERQVSVAADTLGEMRRLSGLIEAFIRRNGIAA
jgi:tape measure domain-containing protein